MTPSAGSRRAGVVLAALVLAAVCAAASPPLELDEAAVLGAGDASAAHVEHYYHAECRDGQVKRLPAIEEATFHQRWAAEDESHQGYRSSPHHHHHAKCPPWLVKGRSIALVCIDHHWQLQEVCVDLCKWWRVNCTARLADAQCQVAGSCNPATGLCATPTNVPDNTTCSLPVLPGKCQSGVCTPDGCFAADTRVVVQGSEATPVRVADLKVGDSIACVTVPGLSVLGAPTTTQWCEVKSMLHADPAVQPQTRISFARPGGGVGSLTVSRGHLIYTLLGGVAEGQSAASVADLADSYELVHAADVAVGSLMPVLANAGSVTGGFRAARITGVDNTVKEPGFFTMAIEHPMVIADGVVAPLTVGFSSFGDAASSGNVTDVPVQLEPPGFRNVFNYIFTSPIWMAFAPQQPVGTRAEEATWDGAVQWPGNAQLAEAAVRFLGEGKRFNVTQWLGGFFYPRYFGWKQGGPAITTEELLAAFEDTWF